MSPKLSSYFYILVIMNVLVVYGTHLSEDYCSLPCTMMGDEMNSACKNKPCDPTPPCQLTSHSDTDKFRNLVVDLHNMYRSKMATKDHSYDLPSAANMVVMNYDMGLEETSRCNQFALQCTMNHDTCRRTKKFELVGQNMATQSQSMPMENSLDFVNTSLKMWFDEIDLVGSGDLQAIGPAGHFTQVVWAKSTHVGCSMYNTEGGGMVTYVFGCNYGPAGNMAGENMYEAGSACSQCPDGLKCNNEYFKGLCGEREGSYDRSSMGGEKSGSEVIFSPQLVSFIFMMATFVVVARV